MTQAEFTEKALRTENPKMYDDIIALAKRRPDYIVDLAGALYDLAVAARAVDAVKRRFLYGDGHYKNSDPMPSVSQIARAIKTAMEVESVDALRQIHGVVGIVGESSELIEWLERSINSEVAYEDYEKTTLELLKEVGDVCWYQAILLDAEDKTIGDAQNVVIAKLAARYPDSFSTEACASRDYDKEHEAVEKALKSES